MQLSNLPHDVVNEGDTESMVKKSKSNFFFELENWQQQKKFKFQQINKTYKKKISENPQFLLISKKLVKEQSKLSTNDLY